MSKTATALRPVEDFVDATLYELSEPYTGLDAWGYSTTASHVIVSSVDGFFGPTTVAFPADAAGETLSEWGFADSLLEVEDKAASLAAIGYEIV